jgi:hypothetical protein
MQGRIEAWQSATQLWAALSQFLSKYPFASAQIIAGHFGIALDSVKMNLARELDLKNSQDDACETS